MLQGEFYLTPWILAHEVPQGSTSFPIPMLFNLYMKPLEQMSSDLEKRATHKLTTTLFHHNIFSQGASSRRWEMPFTYQYSITAYTGLLSLLRITVNKFTLNPVKIKSDVVFK